MRKTGGAMQLITTTNEIRKHRPCGTGKNDTTGLRKLLNYLGKKTTDDNPVNIMTILESNGIEDAIWCLRCFDSNQYNQFVADVAESVLPIFEAKYPNDDRPRKAIEACRNMSADAASAYAAFAAADATYAANAADAAYAAAYAAYAANAANAVYAAYATAYATAAATAAAARAATRAAARAAGKEKWKEIEQLFIKHFGWGKK